MYIIQVDELVIDSPLSSDELLSAIKKYEDEDWWEDAEIMTKHTKYNTQELETIVDSFINKDAKTIGELAENELAFTLGYFQYSELEE